MSISWEKKAATTTTEVTETQEYSSDHILNQKIKGLCEGLQRTIKNRFKFFPTDEDRSLVASFIEVCLHQENVKTSTKQVYILGLYNLSKYFDFKKSFKDMTGQDIADFLAVCIKVNTLTRMGNGSTLTTLG